MTRRLLAMTLLLGLCCASGCAMCCRTYDEAYAAYGGCRQRADMVHGRVGSAKYDPSTSAGAVATDSGKTYVAHTATDGTTVFVAADGSVLDEDSMQGYDAIPGTYAMPGEYATPGNYGVPGGYEVPGGYVVEGNGASGNVDRQIIEQGGFTIVDGKVWVDGEPVDGEVWVDDMPLDRSQMPIARGSMPIMRQPSPARGPMPVVYGQPPEESNLAPVVDGPVRTARGMRPLKPTPATGASRAAEPLWEYPLD